MLANKGWTKAYPERFGVTGSNSSVLKEALAAARKGLWYTYYVPDCDEAC